MQLHIQKDPTAVSHDLAEWITSNIESNLQQKGRFTWVVTGGNSPKLLYELLAAAPYRERIDWSKLHIFWGDERAVPFNDVRNNARMTFEQLLGHVPVVNEQVHIMKTDVSPEESAKDYEKILHDYFGDEGESFDLVLNGMGDDGHTLSLFPHTEVIHETKAWVTSFFLKAQDMYRITLTAPIVNRAHKVAFLTFGANKANALQQVLKGARNIEQYPSQIIQPASGELHWFVDEAAAAGVQ
ncbi:6-phosphogluconolactonase [Paraflavitalea sp. CAU 1676]|uniref:6-phosphogluconolactonase n=1 Tax=Paraflavitalea sp. CAU 1676 TaxID=3032598 RepID=UPI0023D9C0C0|nr:6-phosphogluconolactonase [Paraflavitalea sp. CAU 1676]MDF2190882.1 6-phosphogluconolactonase [Paraflavitalea sp. CAU 1676]